MDVESDRPGINSVSAFYQMCELDKLFIILEIPFSYLWDRNNEALFQECNNMCIAVGRHRAL